MTHALIAGGGIAGAVTAMALQRAGIDATVYEAYPTGADDVGAFLVVFNNGLAALRTLGVLEPVLDASFATDTVRLLSATGRQLSARPTSAFRDSDGRLLGPRTLTRATLYRVLHDEAARRGVTVHHGKRLVSADTASDGTVTAHFADGTSATGDLLVGADGLHSTTRTLIDPEAPRPRHTGRTTVCGYARGVDPAALPPAGAYTMIFGSRVFLGCTRAPGGDVWWFAHVPSEERGSGALASVPPARWRDRLAGLLADDTSPAAAIVRATGDAVVASDACDIARTPRWHRDGMVVIGDAAHAAAPNAAQGASLAAEDGVVLAKCLRDLPDPSSAFTAFEELRRERVEAVVAQSARLGDRSGPRPGAPAPSGTSGTPGAGAGAGAADGGSGRRPEGDDPRGGDTGWLLDYRIDWDEPVAAARTT